jgi:hypothetical protein
MTVAGSSYGGVDGVFLIVLSLMILGCLVQYWGIKSHKRQITRAVQAIPAEVVNISWMPFHSFFTEKNDTFYAVVLCLPSGQSVEAECKCNFWHGVYWKSMPWQHLAVADLAITCGQCGTGCQEAWKFCPHCGHCC